jgi:hypothetical protein
MTDSEIKETIIGETFIEYNNKCPKCNGRCGTVITDDCYIGDKFGEMPMIYINSPYILMIKTNNGLKQFLHIEKDDLVSIFDPERFHSINIINFLSKLKQTYCRGKVLKIEDSFLYKVTLICENKNCKKKRFHSKLKNKLMVPLESNKVY